MESDNPIMRWCRPQDYTEGESYRLAQAYDLGWTTLECDAANATSIADAALRRGAAEIALAEAAVHLGRTSRDPMHLLRLALSEPDIQATASRLMEPVSTLLLDFAVNGSGPLGADLSSLEQPSPHSLVRPPSPERSNEIRRAVASAFRGASIIAQTLHDADPVEAILHMADGMRSSASNQLQIVEMVRILADAWARQGWLDAHAPDDGITTF